MHRKIKIIQLCALLCCLGITITTMANAAEYGETTVYHPEYEMFFPDSDSRYLSGDEIEALTPQELCYARNEIFARLGRKFQSYELQSYFDGCSWYQGYYAPDEFPTDIMNDYEKENVKLLRSKEREYYPEGYPLDTGSSVPVYTQSETSIGDLGYHQFVAVGAVNSYIHLDLDQDGNADEIYVGCAKDEHGVYDSDYYVWVGENEIEGYAENIDQMIYAIRFTEEELLLVISADGPSDDPSCDFYRYKDGQLTYSGTIYTDIDSVGIDENGTMACVVPCRVLQTDTIMTYWKLDKTGMVQQIPQREYAFVYTAGFTYELLQTVTVYEEPDVFSQACQMEPQTITIPYTDGLEWVYLEGENGDGGWLYCDRTWISSNWQEIFNQLFFAD